MTKGKVAVVGAINMDIGGKSNQTIRAFDSNIGTISLSYGGVARNIVENMARLGLDITFFTAFGDDMFGKEIKDNLLSLGVDLSMAETFNHPTSTYLYVADCDGEMQVAINDMSIYELLTEDIAKTKMDAINDCEYVVLDTNFMKETIEYIAKNATAKLIVDAVSVEKAMKLKDVLHCIYLFKPNKLEAEYLTGITINNDDDLEKVAQKFLDIGVKNVAISLGEQGVYIANEDIKTIVPAIKTNVVNATGAGDSFVAGITLGLVGGEDVVNSAKYGVATSSITLESVETVCKQMSKELLLAKMQK